jgi:peptidoglycan/LPS O-acetylase OafA/YrhL
MGRDALGTQSPVSRGTRYWPELDGLRALAVLLVVAEHTDLLRGGYIGVDIFFALSGFLITTVLLEEHAERGTFSLPRFYARRVLRLYPALVVVVLATIPLGVALGGRAGSDTLHEVPFAFTYSLNYVMGTGHYLTGAISHLWSLSIEEQFYLVWPVLLLVMLRNRRAALAATLGVAAALVALGPGFVGLQSVRYEYFAIEARAAQLLIGAAGALAWSLWRAPAQLTRGAAIAGALVIATVVVDDSWPVPRWPDLMPPLLAVATTAIIVHVVSGSSRGFRVLSFAPALALGRISYGVYLWHLPIMFALLEQWPNLNPWVVFGVVAPLTVGFAWCSYRWIELPCLRLKRRLR